MAPKCSTSVGFCALRITRLNPVTGALSPGPNNSYVLNKLGSLGFDPEIDEGDSTVERGGCDDIVVQKKAEDILLRYNLELNVFRREPPLEELLTGGAIITDNAVPANPIGVNWPTPLASGQVGPAVAIEAWSQAWVGDAQRADAPYIRNVWLYTKWRPAGGTLERDFQKPQFVGFSRTNTQLNLNNIYHDFPAGAVLTPQGGWFHDLALPSATDCAYATATSS